MREIDYSLIGDKIRSKRKELSFTQEQVAEYLDINPSHISNIECGRAKPSLTFLVNLANLFSCSMDYFLSSEYNFPPKETDSSDEQIISKLPRLTDDSKKKLLQMMDIL